MKIVFLTIAISCISTGLFGQSKNIGDQNKRIQLFFPVCHFFDGSSTNWLLIAPIRTTSVFGPNNELLYYKTVNGVPFTFGIDWTNYVNLKEGYKISLQTYWRLHGTGNLREPGSVISRTYHELSTSYLRRMIIGRNYNVDVIGELNFRYGIGDIHLFYNNWESVIESIRNRDVGLSTGLKLEHSLPSNLVISGEAKFTRYLYRFDKGIQTNNGILRASPNALTLKLGLGYRFGSYKGK
jgi:hypothetical protein